MLKLISKIVRFKPKMHELTAGDTTCYTYNKQLGFWGLPNINIKVLDPNNQIRPIKITHNSKGLRDREYTFQKNKVTVYCIGGSHTWGAGVCQDERYTDQLSKSNKYNVVNSGHCSLGLDQVCLAILKYSKEYNPGVIVVEQYPWALHRVLNNYVNGYIRPKFSLDKSDNLIIYKIKYYYKFGFLRKIVGNYISFKKGFREFENGINLSDGYSIKYDPIYILWKTRSYESMYKIVDKLIYIISSHCKSNGIKLVFAIGAVQQSIDFDNPNSLIDYNLPKNKLVNILKKYRIDYIDMENALKSEHSVHEPVIFSDGHINQKGHKIFAAEIEKKLNEYYHT